MPTTAIALFSGGLDSILAAKIIEQQNIRVVCVHFTSPFFGNAGMVEHWRKVYNLEIVSRDISEKFVQMLCAGPQRGFGKALNPCIACKVLQVETAARFAAAYGTDILLTGEVLGQRPMSQRRDALDVIRKLSTCEILRPLSAKLLPPTRAESDGLVNRDLLMAISGRGRSEQLSLAGKFALREIPTPAGGCLLTEKENTRRYWPLLKKFWRTAPTGETLTNLVADFKLANIGRQFRRAGHWLCIGRNQTDNGRLGDAKRPDDIILKTANMPGPVALARNGRTWPEEILCEACALVAGCTPKAQKRTSPVEVISRDINARFEVMPSHDFSKWQLPTWEETRDDIREKQKIADFK